MATQLEIDNAKMVKQIMEANGRKVSEQTAALANATADGKSLVLAQRFDDMDEDGDASEDLGDQARTSPTVVVATTQMESAEPKDDFEEEDPIVIQTTAAEEIVETAAQVQTDPANDQTTVPAARPKPTMEDALVAVKRENKRLLTQIAELTALASQKIESDKKALLTAEFVENGYDPDTAGYMAAEKIRTDTLEHQIQVLRFANTNRDMLARYGVLGQEEEIMADVAKTTFTLEQYLRGMFGGVAEPDNIARARAAVRGESAGTPATIVPTVVPGAPAQATPQRTIVLTAADRNNIAEMSEVLGRTYTEAEYIAMRQRIAERKRRGQ